MPERRSRHADSRNDQLRQRIAVEAARIISEHGVRDYHLAKMKAAQRLGATDERSLPGNQDIEAALREHQRIFHPVEQPQLLRRLREAAAEALRFFAEFEPRLVGAVLDGTADEHSAVCLHLYIDDDLALREFLERRRIPFEEQSRRLRFSDTTAADEFPVFRFIAGDAPIDLTVLPYSALRQAPLDRIDQRPMRRAGLNALLALIEQSDAG